MTDIVWNDALKADYQRLWDTCKLTSGCMTCGGSAARTSARIVNSKDRYLAIARSVSMTMPWWLVGVIHHMECGLSFDKHLHNGDPLTSRTTKWPPGRPVHGTPPFTFEESAKDALLLRGFPHIQDWSIAHCLFILEGYNGYGYRMYHPHVNSPYLWSGTNQYTIGKYVRDGHFDATVVSQQLGIVPIMKCGMGLFSK